MQTVEYENAARSQQLVGFEHSLVDARHVEIDSVVEVAIASEQTRVSREVHAAEFHVLGPFVHARSQIVGRLPLLKVVRCFELSFLPDVKCVQEARVAEVLTQEESHRTRARAALEHS